MSDQDQKFGEASVESAQGFAPMSDMHAAPEPKKKEYSGEETGIREAAEDLSATRAKTEAAPIDRTYIEYGGPDQGKAVDPNETISLERASADLTRQRGFEHEAAQRDTARLPEAVDAVRAAYPNRELPPDFVENMQAHAEQARQSQAEAPSEFNDQARADMAANPEPQPQQPQDPTDEIRQVLEQHPAVRQALEAEISQVEAERQKYATATWQAAQVSAAALFSQYPALAQVNSQELPGAIALIEKSDPATGAKIRAHIAQVQSLYSASQQAKAQQEQLRAAQVDQWARAEDARFDKEIFGRETPEMQAKLKAVLPEIIEKDYKISPAAFGEALRANPVLRSASFQTMLLDAAKYRLAQREVVEKKFTPLPPVQRPGVSQDRGNDAGLEAAIRAFNNNPGPATGSALLTARRNATRR